jgi:hypothetical protein
MKGWFGHFVEEIEDSIHIGKMYGGLNQILKRQTSRFHYGAKVPAVVITVFITILEQNR